MARCGIRMSANEGHDELRRRDRAQNNCGDKEWSHTVLYLGKENNSGYALEHRFVVLFETKRERGFSQGMDVADDCILEGPRE